MPSFFVERDGERAVIVGDDARHLARSLRARMGEMIEVVDPRGQMLTVRLDVVTDRPLYAGEMPAAGAAFEINARQSDEGAEQDFSAVILQMEKHAHLGFNGNGTGVIAR